MRTKSNLDNARRNKNDEYYTYYADDFDIVGIIKHGKDHKYDICRPFVNGVEKYTRLVIRRNLRGE